MKKIRTLIVVILIAALGFYLYFNQAVQPFNPKDNSVKVFVIPSGESTKDIANSLANHGLIRDRLVFYLIIKSLQLDKNIQAGDFRLSPSMDAYTIAKTLTHGTLDVWVTLIEGMRKEEMAQVISENLGIPEVDFDQYGKEGYLFPDTYLFPKNSTSKSIVQTMENNFNKKFTPEMRDKVERLGLTVDQAVVLASIVEKEAKRPQDKPIVAGILLKRLRADWPLQVDASIQYALGYQAGEHTWWKKDLTAQDLAIDSPYNTYTNKGLPPTPICNPGLASLEGVANAQVNTPYWFYLSDNHGNMHFSKTIEEHNANIKKYLQ